MRPLTPKENEVLLLLRLGKSNSEIATTLAISINTVKTHMKSVYKKLEARNRTEAVVKSIAMEKLKNE